MKDAMKNFCDIVREHWWQLVGIGCGFKVYRCARCGWIYEEHE